MLNRKQKNDMMGLLDTHYAYVTAGIDGHNEEVYYEGMINAYEYLLISEHMMITRDKDGIHHIVNSY